MWDSVNKTGLTKCGRTVRLAVTAIALVMAVQACGTGSASGRPAVEDSTQPGRAATAASSRFFAAHAPLLATDFPKVKPGAVNLTLNGVYWGDIETASGVFDFTHLDTLVKQAHAHGAQPLLVLGQTPAFHSTSPGSPQVWATVPTLDAWKAYVHKVVDRYRTRLDYEIWPEANITSNWAGTPHQLATLVSAAARIIHQAAPHAIVVSPAMVLRLPYERHWMEKFFAQKVGGTGIGHVFDAIGLDPYPMVDGTPEDSAALIGKARRILAKHKVTAPVWNVEINYGVVGGGQTIRHHSSGTRQASYVVRTYVLNAAAGVRRVYWLGWGTFKTLDVALAASNGTPTKAGRALKVVASWLNGQKAGACAHNKKQHLYACKQVKSGRASWVYWTTKGKTVVRAPKGSRHVATMTGAVSKTRAHKKLTITSAPIRVYH
jgi:polysaccharide biosynthesis protein PslG